MEPCPRHTKRRQVMIELIVQLVIVSIWGTMVGIHTRRLLRLAHIELAAPWQDQPLWRKLNRVWWWLGREEYWRGLVGDCARCVQLMLMILLLVWGTSG